MRSFVRKSSLFVALFIIIGLTAANAADRYAVANGNWNSTATWSATSGGSGGASAPVAGDNVFIEGGFTVTIVANAACANITIGTATSGVLTFNTNGNVALDASGNILVNSNGSITVGDASGDRQHTFNIGGNLTVDGLFNMVSTDNDACTVIFDGASNQTISGSGVTCIFQNVTISNTGSALVTLARNITLTPETSGNASLTISTNSDLDLTTFTANRSVAGGTLTLGSNSKLFLTGVNNFPANFSTHSVATNSLVQYYGGVQTIATLNSSQSYGALDLSGIFTAGTKTLAGPISVATSLNIAATTVDLSTFSLTTGASSSTSLTSFTGKDASVIGTGSLVLGGDLVANNSSGAGFATISAPVSLGTAIRTFNVLNGSAAIDLDITGVISGAGGGITKTNIGTLNLSGNNSYTGKTTVTDGTLSFSSIANLSTNSALGAPAVANGTIDIGATGILKYIGSGHSTNRVINLAASGGTIDASGTGLLTLTGGVTGLTRSLVLTGSSTGLINSIIATSTGAVTKNGTGTWTLAGANTYTGATTINAGILSVGTLANGGSNSNIGASTNAAANLVMGGGTLQYTGATVAIDRNYTLTAGTTSSIEITTAGTNLTISGGSANTTGGVTKIGAGTLILTGVNSHTGLTTISLGELRLNPSANITPNTQVVLNGGKLSTTGITATRTIINASTLKLDASSSIDLGSTEHTLRFAASDAVAWAGTTLTINNWGGTAGASNTTRGKIFIGTSATGLTAAQLAKITFAGYPCTAMLLSTGELVPAALPAATITAGGPVTFCPGGSVTLTASAGTSWLWSNGETTQSINVATSGNYSVTVTSNGCSTTSATTVVTVNPVPTVDDPTDVVVCNGATTSAINFTGTANSYTWTNDNPSIGLAASGTGSIPSFLTVNGGATPITATITVTPRPLVLAYIVGSTTNNVSVVNTATNTIVATIPVGSSPYGIALNKNGNKVYVGNFGDNSVSVIDAASNTVVATIPVGTGPRFITVSPDGSRVYVANENSNNVSVINAVTNSVIATVPVANRPYGISIHPDGSKVYVTRMGTNQVTIINTSTNTVSSNITVGTGPSSIILSPDGSRAYTANYGSGTMSVINTSTNGIITTVNVGSEAYDLTISPDGSKVYVSRWSANAVAVVNTTTYTFSTITVGNKANGVAITPGGSSVYAINQWASTVSVINTATNLVTSTFNVVANSNPTSFGEFIGGNDCVGTPQTFTITVNPSTLADDPADVTRCDSYTLPALTNGNYFTGAGGTGTALSAGATITSTQTIYVYNPGTAPCLPAENSFLVTINNTPLADDPQDVIACGSYSLPALTNGNYFNSPNGVGPLSVGDIITGTTTIYVYAQSGTTPNCTSENSFLVTVNPIPTANISYSGSPYCKAGKAFVNQTGQGGGTYSFTPAGLSIGATGDVDLELSTAGTYTVTYSFSNGNCSSTTSTTIVINPLPACSITGTDGPVCPSSNNNYSAPAGMSTYAWSLENANGATFTTATNSQNVTVKAGAGCNTSYKLKLTITDANNCSSTCEKTVTVQDVTKPTITLAAANGSVECGSLATPTLNSWLNNHGGATATDGCTGAGQLVWTNNYTSLSDDCGNTGSATVTFRVTDACGNYEETTATFSVVDNTDPTWTSIPANLTVECDGSGNETALNDWLYNSFSGTDNCGYAFVSNNFTSLSNGCGATGSATVTFVLTDECGNSISKIATFTIADTEKPSATAGTIASCYPTVAAAEAAAIAATTYSDACAANNELTVTAATVGSCNAVITVTVTDPCGNARNVTYNTKIDNTKPVITATSVTATALGCNPSAATIEAALGGATASDNCDGDITTSILPATDAAIVNGCQYSQTRRWNVADACGNNAVEVTRTVTWKVDLIAPVFSEEPASATAECSSIPTAPVITASDVCDGTVTVNFTETSTKGTDATQCSFYNYIIYRAWSAADACGNTTTHTQTITVSDDTNPTVDGNDIASCYATVAAAEAAAIAATTYSDNCAANGNLTVTASTTGTCSAIITVTVKDPCNNSGQYIYYTKIDNTIPVITATSETATALGCNPSAATIEAALGGATAEDNCDGDITASILPTTDLVEVNGCMRSQTRRWNVADACGNNAVEVTRTVTWKVDMLAPVIIATNAAASTDLGCNPTATVIDEALGGATASDNCDGDITASIVPTTDNEIVTGCYRSQTRRWNVEDGCGNDAIEVSRTVTWKVDITAPVITANNAAAPTNLSCNPFLGQIDAALGGATANDNCDGNITSSIVTTTDPVVVISSCMSSQTRRWNVSDACGNPALEVTRTVTWRTDLVIPVITVINAALPTGLGCNPTASQINGALGGATASDNCDGNLNPDIIATTDAVVVDGCMRSQTRRWNVKDGCNNHAEEVSRTVTWKVDMVVPVITATNAAAATDLGCNPTAAQIDAALSGATASDNCGGDITASIVVITDPEVVNGCMYSQTRRWNVEDECGNDAVEVTRTVTWKVDLTAPVLSVQPANTTAECNNIPTVPSVTASDVCDGTVTVNFNETSTKGTDATQCSFYNYVIYRAWSAADACGNTTTHTQTITVSDNTAPSVTKGSIASCYATAAEAEAAAKAATTYSDNCAANENLTVTASTTGDCAAVITVTLKDPCGKEASVTYNTKIDNTIPVITSTSVTATALGCNPSAATIEAALGGATASDNCDGDITASIVPTTDDVIVNGCMRSQTRRWNVADACGNNAVEVTRTVTWKVDLTAPVFSEEPANTTAECDNIPTAPSVTASDVCDGAVTVNFNETSTKGTDATQCSFYNYIIYRAWSAADACGNTTSHTQTITVSDNTKPTVSKDDIAICYPTVAAAEAAAIAATTYSDNCAANTNLTVTASTTGTCNGVVTVTVTDPCGNFRAVTYNVRIDNNAPVLSGQPAATVAVQCDAVPTAAVVTALDNCQGVVPVNFTETSTKGTDATQCSFYTYTIYRAWSAADACGNTTTFTQTITVSDDTAPVLTVPADASAECDAVPGAANAADASATDNCDQSPKVTYVGEVSTQTNNGTCSDQQYTITRTWKAEDKCGNSSTKSQVITISDNTAPVLTVPADASAECSALPIAGVAGDASAIDNCDATPTVTYVGEVSTQTNNGTCSDQNYTITRTWKAEDNCGNSSTKKQVITVSDNTAPLLTVPANASMPCDIPVGEATAADASATDNCDATPDVTYLGEVSTKTTNGTCSDQNYTITRTWKAEDNCGNSTILSQVITVSDTKAPVLTVPASTSAECDAVPAAATAGDASAEDNCDATPTVTYLGETSTQTNDGSCSDQNYTITRTWKAEDNCGNSSFKSQTITISDTKAPVLTVPSNTTAECSALPAAATAANASALDNCDQTPTVTYLGEVSTKTNNGTCSDQNYTLTRTWKAEDNCGNSSTKSQVITVSDNTAPVLTVPANASAECDEVPETASAGDASAIDNCDATPTVTYLGETTTQTGIGTCGYLTYTITRTWKAEDNCGNSTTKSQTITITDNTAPVLTGVPASTTVSCDAIPVVPTVTANDNCNATVAVNFATSNTKGTDPSQCSYYNYIIYRAWSAADACGNTTTQTQTLTVVDATAPTGNSPTGTANIDACAAGASTAVPFNATEAAAGYTDNCGSPVTAILTNTQVTGGDCGWTLTYTYKVKDVCGNELPGQTVVHTGSDKTVPTAIAKNITVPLNAAGTVSITATQVNNGSSDLCTAAGNLTLQVTPSTFTCANVGPNVVTFKVIDACGNSSSTTAIVTVQDVTPPTAVCQNITVNLDASGNAVITPAMINNGSTDACGIQGYSLSKTAFTCADLSPIPSSDLYISEYIEGLSNNKAIEIYNGTGAAVNLGTGGYAIRVYSNGATSFTSVALTGTIAAGDVYVVANGSSNAAILAQADLTSSVISYNGNDAVALVKGTTILDVIGQIGNDPGTEWGTGLTSTADNTIRRKASITKGDNNGSNAFDPATEWDGFATDNSANLGAHTVNGTINVVTLTVTDVNGNTSTCTATVTVKDLIAPTVTTAANALDVTVQCSDASGIAAAVAALPTATDNCGTPTRNLLTDVTSPGCGTTFTRVRTWNFSDASGNTSTTFTQTITVIDNTAPVVLTKNITIQLSAAGTASIVAADVNNGSSDNCTTTANLVLSVTPSSFDCSKVGPNTVTLKVTDQCGNSSTNTAIVTVQDVTPPTAVCQNVTVNLDANGQATITPAQVNNGSSDACGGLTYSLDKTTFDCTNVGLDVPTDLIISEYVEGSSSNKYIEIYNGTGASINLANYQLRLYANGAATATNTVTLSGTLASGATIVYKNSLAIVYAGTATTNSSVNFNGDDAVAITKLNGDFVDIFGRIGSDPGTAWTGAGGYTTAAKTLRRKSSVIKGITVSPTGTGVGAFTTLTTEWDLFNIDIVTGLGNHTLIPQPKQNPVTLTVTDANGNSSTCTANVTVLDLIAPIVTNAAGSLNATVECSNASAIAAAIAAAPTATDNCGPVTIHLVGDVTTAGCGTTYTRVRTWNFTDPSGNTSLNFVQTIITEDHTNPTIGTAASNQKVECDGAGNTAAFNSWLTSNAGAAATDLCSGVTWSNNFVAANWVADCGNSKHVTVIFTAKDACNNASTTTATFTIEDKTAPVIGTSASNQKVECDGAGNTAAFNAWLTSNAGAAATDGCGSGVNWSNNYVVGNWVADCGNSKHVTVIFSATDNCNNASTTTATFTIEDKTAPVIGTSASNQKVECDGAGNTAAFNTWLTSNAGAAATDGCGSGVNWSNNYVVGNWVADCGNSKHVTVIFTATDNCNNASTTTATFTIEDKTAPVIGTSASNQKVECDGAGNTAAFNTWLTSNAGAAATDGCGSGVNWSNNYVVGNWVADCGNSKHVTVIFTAKDNCNNASTTTATFTIEDKTAPSITAPTNLNVKCASAVPAAATNYAQFILLSGAATNDDCSAAITITHTGDVISDQTCTNRYVITRTYKATDACGNSSFAAQTITVYDDIAPVVTCKSNATRSANTGVCTYTTVGTEFNPASASDNCNSFTLTYGLSGATSGSGSNTLAGVVFNKGVTTVTWYIADACEQTAQCSFTVTVNDNEKPIITSCPTVAAVNYSPADCGAQITVPALTATDNCTSFTVGWAMSGATTGTGSGASIGNYLYGYGTTTISWTVTDASGNTQTCTTTVQVNKAPTTSVLTVTPISQQYSDTVRLKVVIYGGASTCVQGGPNAAGYATFTINGQVMRYPASAVTNVPFVVNGNNLEAILTTPLLDYIDNFGNGVMKPGAKTVSAMIYGIANEFAVAQPVTTSLTVTQETAKVIYTGDLIKATATATTTTAPITLRANIHDITAIDPVGDPYAGDIRNARARFVLRNGSTVTPVSGWMQVTTLVDPSNKKIGTISYDSTFSVGTTGYQFFTIGVEVNDGGYYYSNNPQDDIVLTVYQPVGDFITGGGCIIPTQSAGSYASDPGQKVNFGFNVKFNKKGTNLQGNMNIIFRRTMPDNILHLFQIKANAMQSLGVNISDPTRKTAEYLSKVNLTDVTNPTSPVSVAGGLFLFVKMVDRGEPGTNDSISFVLVKGNGNSPSDPTVLANIYWSSHWVGNMTQLLKLECGNLVVHSGFSTGSAKIVAPDLITEAEKAEPAKDEAISPTLDVKVLGNPSETNFTLIPQGSLPDAITVRVTDAFGRVMEVKSGVRNGQSIRFGNNYRPGTYFAEIVQGRLRKVVMLIKQ